MLETDETDAPLNALKLLLSHIVTGDAGRKKSIGEFVTMASLNPLEPEIRDTLARYGLALSGGYLYVAADHPQTKYLFRANGITGHYGLLSLIAGSETGEIYMFGTVKSRAVKIPINIFM